ncbi:MAG: EamA family transporter, partial [Chitinophagales bacterium]
MTSEQRKAYYTLHLCVFIWGFTAILGNLISLQETVLVWYRMGITALSLLLLPDLWRNLKGFSKKQLLHIAGVGILVAFHWITFYGAIKYANVSVALTCMATVSLFTAFIEPLFFKTSVKIAEVIMG